MHDSDRQTSDTTQEQAVQLENWNRTLEERIREQRAEIERLNQLKRYFSPQLAEYIISSGDEPAGQAVRMALAIRDEMTVVLEDWQHRGHDLGFGIGLAMGYATLGQIGFAGHFHYGAIGSVLNLASRLCDQAGNEQVLLSQRMYAEIDHLAEAKPVGDLSLKGFHKPVNAFNVTRLKS